MAATVLKLGGEWQGSAVASLIKVSNAAGGGEKVSPAVMARLEQVGAQDIS